MNTSRITLKINHVTWVDALCGGGDVPVDVFVVGAAATLTLLLLISSPVKHLYSDKLANYEYNLVEYVEK